MTAARRLEILSLLLGDDDTMATSRLCTVCADVTGVTGAGIMLMVDGDLRGSVCSTDAVSALIERLQFELGEGPCVDACREDRPVSEADLASPRVPRWTAFTPEVVAAGARAVFGFPLQVGAVRLGALNLYSDRARPLTDTQHADALLVASMVAQAILAMQAGAPPGQLAVELESGTDFQYVVHQAAGMVAAQLEVGVGVALVRLRAHAFAVERPLADVARDVVARMLRFDDGNGLAEGRLRPS